MYDMIMIMLWGLGGHRLGMFVCAVFAVVGLEAEVKSDNARPDLSPFLRSAAPRPVSGTLVSLVTVGTVLFRFFTLCSSYYTSVGLVFLFLTQYCYPFRSFLCCIDDFVCMLILRPVALIQSSVSWWGTYKIVSLLVSSCTKFLHFFYTLFGRVIVPFISFSVSCCLQLLVWVIESGVVWASRKVVAWFGALRFCLLRIVSLIWLCVWVTVLEAVLLVAACVLFVYPGAVVYAGGGIFLKVVIGMCVADHSQVYDFFDSTSVRLERVRAHRERKFSRSRARTNHLAQVHTPATTDTTFTPMREYRRTRNDRRRVAHTKQPTVKSHHQYIFDKWKKLSVRASRGITAHNYMFTSRLFPSKGTETQSDGEKERELVTSRDQQVKERSSYDTPDWVLDLIHPFIPPDVTTIYDPFYDAGKCSKFWKERHYNVLHSSTDSFDAKKQPVEGLDYDLMITNALHEEHATFLRSLRFYNRFAVLMPVDCLTRSYWSVPDVQIIFIVAGILFERNGREMERSSPRRYAWVTRGFDLPRPTMWLTRPGKSHLLPCSNTANGIRKVRDDDGNDIDCYEWVTRGLCSKGSKCVLNHSVFSLSTHHHRLAKQRKAEEWRRSRTARVFSLSPATHDYTSAREHTTQEAVTSTPSAPLTHNSPTELPPSLASEAYLTPKLTSKKMVRPGESIGPKGEVRSSRLLTVDMWNGSQPFPVLFDTGANFSVIDAVLAMHLTHRTIRTLPIPIDLSGVGGDVNGITHYVTTPLRLEQDPEAPAMMVSMLLAPPSARIPGIILGDDFLDTAEAVIDTSVSEVRFPELGTIRYNQPWGQDAQEAASDTYSHAILNYTRNRMANTRLSEKQGRELYKLYNKTLGEEEDENYAQLINPHLSSVDKEKLNRFIRKNYDTFMDKGQDFSELHARVGEHRIDLTDEGIDPVYVHPYRVSPRERLLLEELVQELLDKNVIRESISPWSFPVVLVDKPGGKKRFCVNYKRLNDITKKSRFPLPRMEQALEKLAKAKHYTKIDLDSGFWQVKVAEEHKERTAFSTPFGHFEFNVMPFGLTNAPATFQRTMTQVLSKAGILNKTCLVYVDDIICFAGNSLDEHMLHVQEILNALEKAGLKAKLSKCHFAMSTIEYLGLIVDGETIRMKPSRIQSIKDLDPYKVKGRKDIQIFLGLMQAYSRFIPDLHRMSAPIRKVMGKKIGFSWGDDQVKAFIRIRDTLAHSQPLFHPDYDHPFCIATDASKQGLSGYLFQQIGGEKRTIEFISRALRPNELNWHINEQEAQAVIWALEKFRHYVYGTHITVYTDSSCLKWIMTTKSQGRIARWAMKLLEFDITLENIKGKDNIVPDALSRLCTEAPNLVTRDENNAVVSFYSRALQAKFYVSHGQTQISNEKHPHLPTLQEFSDQQRADPVYGPIMRVMMDEMDESELPSALRNKLSELCLYKQVMHSIVNNDLTTAKIVVPDTLRSRVIAVYHDSLVAGHCGIDKTLSKLQQMHYWVNMRRDVQAYVRSCNLCQQFALRRPAKTRPVSDSSREERPFECLSIDIVGRLNTTKGTENIAILSVMCCFSRWTYSIPIRDTKTETIVDALWNHVWSHHGVSARLISDNGPQFTSRIYNHMCRKFKIKPVRTAIYNPAANPVERYHSFLKKLLSIFVKQYGPRLWDRYLPTVDYIYRTSPIAGLDISPFEIVYGRKPLMPQEVFQQDYFSISADVRNYALKLPAQLASIAKTVKDKRERMLASKRGDYDKTYYPHHYNVGERVWIYRPPKTTEHIVKKFTSPWHGPYEIVEKISDVTYVVLQGRKKVKVHPNIMSSYRLRPSSLDVEEAPAVPVDAADPAAEFYDDDSDAEGATDTMEAGGDNNNDNHDEHDHSESDADEHKHDEIDDDVHKNGNIDDDASDTNELWYILNEGVVVTFRDKEGTEYLARVHSIDHEEEIIIVQYLNTPQKRAPLAKQNYMPVWFSPEEERPVMHKTGRAGWDPEVDVIGVDQITGCYPNSDVDQSTFQMNPSFLRDMKGENWAYLADARVGGVFPGFKTINFFETFVEPTLAACPCA
jgi:hypothetical protein